MSMNIYAMSDEADRWIKTLGQRDLNVLGAMLSQLAVGEEMYGTVRDWIEDHGGERAYEEDICICDQFSPVRMRHTPLRAPL